MRIRNKELKQRRHRKEQAIKAGKRDAIAGAADKKSTAPPKAAAPKPVAKKPAAPKPAAEKKAPAKAKKSEEQS